MPKVGERRCRPAGAGDGRAFRGGDRRTRKASSSNDLSTVSSSGMSAMTHGRDPEAMRSSWVIGERVVGREHVDPCERAPRPADRVKPPPLPRSRRPDFFSAAAELVARGALAPCGWRSVEGPPAATRSRARRGLSVRRRARGCRRRVADESIGVGDRGEDAFAGSPAPPPRSEPRSRNRCDRSHGRIRRRPWRRGSRPSPARVRA